MTGRAAGRQRAGGWGGAVGRGPHPSSAALALGWVGKGHEGEWAGEAGRQARAKGWRAGREDGGQGQRREKNKGVRMEESAPGDLWVPQSPTSWTESPEGRAGPRWGGPGSEVAARGQGEWGWAVRVGRAPSF